MPTSYVHQSGVPMSKYFDQFMELLGAEKAKREALQRLYTGEIGDRSLEDYTIGQIKEDITYNPMRFFALVSALLGTPPRALSVDDRLRIANGLEITVRSQSEYLKVTDQGVWLRELVLKPPHDPHDEVRVGVHRYEYHLSMETGSTEIVPTPVLQYLRSAIICFNEAMLMAAAALAAIAFEACLRAVLRGLGHNTRTLPPSYKPGRARIKPYLTGQELQLSFEVRDGCCDIREHFLKDSPCETASSMGSVKFNIVRQAPKSEGSTGNIPKRVSLIIKTDRETADLLTSDQHYETGKTKILRSFREFSKAADRHGMFRASQLSPETRETLLQVRNYLIHWDPSRLNQILHAGQTVADYINDPLTINKTLQDVTDFISNKYYSLRVHQMIEKEQRGM